MKPRSITLICADEASTLETVALRGALEYFGYVVSAHWVGNKQSLLDLLQTDETNDFVVICAHGKGGAFFVPNDESVRSEELSVRLPNSIVLSMACETAAAASRFLDGGCSMYIAPEGYPEGNDALYFALSFFWRIAQGNDARQAFEDAAKQMPNGSEFVLSKK
jgi:hypothetical protein